MKRTLLFQLVLIVVSVVALAEWALFFPYPSPLTKPFLSPNNRWPTEQVEGWVEFGNFSGDFLEYFARDPERIVPAGRNVVSPADGILDGIPSRNGTAYFVVKLSFWDVHVVRTPVAGVVKHIAQEGYYFTRDVEKDVLDDNIFLRGKAAPVQQIITLETDYGEVRVRLITSYWASRLKVWVREGQELEKGQRVGRILAGSTVVAEFPDRMKFSVQPRQRVVGGETIISDGVTQP